MFRRRRFGELVDRQLELFAEEHAGLLRDVRQAELAYDRAARDEAEERYGDYVDLVDTAAGLLVELRDAYAATLDEATAEVYADDFARAALRRFPRLALELEDT